MDVINPLSSPSLVGSATSQGRGWSGQNQQLPALGQLFKAVVVEAREGGRFTLDIGGSQLTASSKAPLSQGQALQLQVVKTEPLIELKIVHDNTSAPFAGRSLTLLGKSIDLTSLMQTVRQFEPTVLQQLTPATRNVLESFSNLQQNVLPGKDNGATLKQLIDNIDPNPAGHPPGAGGSKMDASQPLKAALLELVHVLSSSGKTTGSAGTLPEKGIDLTSLIQTVRQLNPEAGKSIDFSSLLQTVRQLIPESGKGIDLTSLLQTVRQPNSGFLESLAPATRNLLESFFASQQSTLDGKDGGAILKQLIDKLGLNLEHLLAKGDKSGAAQTLKAALLELAHSFSGSDKISENAGKLITTLELFQLTQLHIGADNNYIFPLPLPFVEQGYLLVEGDGDNSENGNKQAERRFSLHLTMSELGNLRIDFLKNDEGLFIRFSADSKDKADFLATFGEELKASITDIPLIGLTFAADAPDPINDLLRKLLPAGRSMLDMKV